MAPRKEDVDAVDRALEEAVLVGVEARLSDRRAIATLAVLTSPVDGPVSDDPRIQLDLRSVRRAAARLRERESEADAWRVVPFALDELLDVVMHEGAAGHSLWLFQDATQLGRELDVWLWFDDFRVRMPDGAVLPFAELHAASRRWWDAFERRDPRTEGRGLFPLD